MSLLMRIERPARRSAVWASSAEGARYASPFLFLSPLGRPFWAEIGKRVCIITQADGLGWGRAPLWSLTTGVPTAKLSLKITPGARSTNIKNLYVQSRNIIENKQT